MVEPLVLQIASTFERWVARVPDRLQRVRGLAGLRDRHDQRRVVEDRVAVAELEDSSTSTGTRVQCSMAYLATIPA